MGPTRHTLMPLWAVGRGKKYALSGAVVDGGSSGIGSVTITLTGDDSGSTSTDASGSYAFSGVTALRPGDYTITPTKTNFTFTPVYSDQTVSNADITGVDFLGLEWLLKDEFTTADAAPITSPRTCEPGPGSLNTKQTGNELSISGGQLVITQNAADSGVSAQISALGGDRSAGMTAACKIVEVSAGLSSYLAFHNSTTPGSAAGPYIHFRDDEIERVYDALIGSVTLGHVVTFPQYALIACRSVGSFHIIGGKLLWVFNVFFGTPDYVILFNNNTASKFDDFSYIDLPANGYSEWDADFSTVTDSESTPANGTNIDCDADFHLQSTFTYETGKNVYWYFRYTDSSHFVYARAASDGNLLVRKNEGGGEISIVSSVGVFADGVEYQVDIVAYGSIVTVFIDNVQSVQATNITYNQTVAQARIEHNLATNDIELETHPYPSLGIATDRVIAPQDSDTGTMTADALSVIRSLTIPSGNFQMELRKAGSDEITLDVAADGSFTLKENATTRITGGAGSISDGDDVTTILDGVNGQVFANNTSKGSTSAIASVLTGTTYNFADADDGANSVEFWPRDVSSLLPASLV